MASLVIFCIQICLIQYVFSQRVNGPPMVNNGLQYGSNAGLVSPLQGPAQLGGVINGPGPMGPNQALGPYGQIMPNGQTFPGAGMPNKVYAGASMPNNQFYNGAGVPYGGAGNGDVAVTGELPVAGMTAVTGQVPLTGKVSFNGNVPCGGVVTITGGCTSCGLNAPYGQMPAYGNIGNKPYGY